MKWQTVYSDWTMYRGRGSLRKIITALVNYIYMRSSDISFSADSTSTSPLCEIGL